MPYIAGANAARNTIDIVRAARQLPDANTSTHYVVWGHSEGGQTAMFGLHIAEVSIDHIPGRSDSPTLQRQSPKREHCERWQGPLQRWWRS